MSAQILTLLAAAGLVSTGVTATTETRSEQAFPVQKVAMVKAPAKGAMGNCLVSLSKGKDAKQALASAKGVATRKCSNQLMQAGGIVPGAVGGGIGTTVGIVVGVGVAVGVGVTVATQS